MAKTPTAIVAALAILIIASCTFKSTAAGAIETNTTSAAPAVKVINRAI